MGLLFSPLPPPARRQGRRSSSHAMKQPPFPSWMVLWRCGRSLGASTDVQHQDSCRRSTSRLVPSARQEGAHSYPGWVIQRPLATSLQLNRRCFRRGHSPFFARPLAIPCGNFPSASFHPGAATRYAFMRRGAHQASSVFILLQQLLACTESTNSTLGGVARWGSTRILVVRRAVPLTAWLRLPRGWRSHRSEGLVGAALAA